MATSWRRVWMPQTETPQFAALAPAYEMWLAARLQEGSSYDEIVEADYRAFLRVVGETLRAPSDADLRLLRDA